MIFLREQFWDLKNEAQFLLKMAKFKNNFVYSITEHLAIVALQIDHPILKTEK